MQSSPGLVTAQDLTRKSDKQLEPALTGHTGGGTSVPRNDASPFCGQTWKASSLIPALTLILGSLVVTDRAFPAPFSHPQAVRSFDSVP